MVCSAVETIVETPGPESGPKNGRKGGPTKASPCHSNSERLDRPSDLRSRIVSVPTSTNVTAPEGARGWLRTVCDLDGEAGCRRLTTAKQAGWEQLLPKSVVAPVHELLHGCTLMRSVMLGMANACPATCVTAGQVASPAGTHVRSSTGGTVPDRLDLWRPAAPVAPVAPVGPAAPRTCRFRCPGAGGTRGSIGTRLSP